MNRTTNVLYVLFTITLGTVFLAQLPGEQATGGLTETSAAAVSSAWGVTNGSMAAQRASPTATLLPSGTVLIAGGEVVVAELYHPGAGVFKSTAPVEHDRRLHTATLLPTGKVLLVGGHGSDGNSLASVEVYDPASEEFALLPNSLSQPRENHTATLLPEIGKVLIVGGIDAVVPVVLRSAELFDSQDGSWSNTSTPPLVDRWGHTASLLPTGEVMVVGGGMDNGFSTARVELYDPVLESWSELDDLLAIDRRNHTATVLSDGRVLVTGGIRDGAPDVVLNSAEIYDPDTGQWSGPAAMSEPRFNHAAVLLPSGRVLVMGGQDLSYADLASAELFDPDLGTWQSVDDMTIARRDHDATLLPSGEVLVVGGRGRTSAEIYRPEGDFWYGTTGPLEGSRYYHTATLLSDGKLLIAGGSSAQTTEIYDPATGTTTTGEEPLEAGRKHHTATLLPSGEVLLVGGESSLIEVELYDPSTVPHTTTAAASLTNGRYNHTATLLPSGGVLVAGGVNGQGEVAAAEIFLPDRSWTAAGSLATARSLHTATLLPSGKVLVAGGSVAGGGTTAGAELYDPTDDVWSSTGAMSSARSAHTATLLPSGKVLVAGGSGDARAELYDPATGSWSVTDSLASGRKWHSATLLPSGKVLVTGGETVARASLASAELYDPATGTWSDAGSMLIARSYHTATLLPTLEVVVVGGFGGSRSTERYHPRSFLTDQRPQLTSASVLQYGDSVAGVNGAGFRGGSEASHGQTGNSAVNFPLVRLMPIEDPQVFYLSPDAVPNGTNGAMTLDFSRLPPGLTPGWHLLSVDVAGVPSEAIPAEVECGFEILDPNQPLDVVDVPLGDSAAFSIETESGRSFTWYRDGYVIPGATGSTYVTPIVVASDSGSTYQVRVDSGCRQYLSRIATLTVRDGEDPAVTVVTPDGGEYWKLSDDEETYTEVISWSMSDNIRICQVEVSLLYSNDGGPPYLPAPAGGLLATFGTGGTCPHPGESTTSMEYTVPTSPPSGVTNSRYKIEVRVTDHAGRTTTARSNHPFFMIQSGQSVSTLILANSSRMVAEMDDVTEAEELDVHLDDLALHGNVQGFVVDLGVNSDLETLYAAWAADSESPEPDPDFANLVLFGCHGDPLPAGCPGELDGIHDVVRELVDAYPGVEYLILVGDDRIIPMARLKDRTTGYLESNYTSDDPFDLNAGLTPGGTTVGRALAADRFLSDDPLATLATIHPSDLRQDENLFLPDLAAGRLVEEPAEIITAIATFISQNGLLDLTALDPDTGHKVLLTGYDFLIDSAKKNRRWWKNALDLPEPHDDDALAPVDGQLISEDWGKPTVAERRAALRTHLSGHGLRRYGVMNLNGHATHFEEGVPGADRLDIQGLPAVDVYGSDACGTSGLGALDLAGAVVYAVGCHAGLAVPGSCATDPEHSLDLPQTMLARGVTAYLANTGYGWGLLNGIGVSERLVEIFTEEMTRGDTVFMGELLTRSKLRYFLEAPRFDAYDLKTSMQWALYGFPMYQVRTGSARQATPSLLDPLPAPRRSPEHFGPVTVEWSTGSDLTLPPFLSRLELRFDFTAAEVYQKHNASGEPLAFGGGCPEPAPGEPEGCYYTLNSLVERATGESDLPIQPYIIYDSRLSGTSQHGVLWKGASYDEESGWVPVIGELVSNGGDLSDHGSLPRKVFRKPRGPRRRLLGEEPDCRPSDLELNSIVLATGEVVKDEESAPDYPIQRLHREVDLEIFYYNNTHDGEGNCDRDGPLFGADPYHSVIGRTVSWTVPASDEAGVWRVVVVYDDEVQRRWVPVELTDAGDGTWTGSDRIDDAERLTYFLQAVDLHGNVSWLEYEQPEPAASGIALEIPSPVDALFIPGEADLEIAMSAAPDPVLAGDPLHFRIAVTNLGPEPADSVVVSSELPAGVTYLLSGGTGWSCGEAVGTVTCTRDTLENGSASLIRIYVTAPAVGGPVSMTATVSAANDPNPDNNVAPGEVLIVDETMTDLAVVKEDGGVAIVPGQPITYSITVTNNGPNPVYGATVTDYFPPELHSITWTCEATVGSFCTESGTGDIVDTVDLLPQGTLLYKATAIVAEGTTGPVTNFATVTVPPGMSDFEPQNNRSPSLIFADGFESGDTSAWSTEVDK